MLLNIKSLSKTTLNPIIMKTSDNSDEKEKQELNVKLKSIEKELTDKLNTIKKQKTAHVPNSIIKRSTSRFLN